MLIYAQNIDNMRIKTQRITESDILKGNKRHSDERWSQSEKRLTSGTQEDGISFRPMFLYVEYFTFIIDFSLDLG